MCTDAVARRRARKRVSSVRYYAAHREEILARKAVARLANLEKARAMNRAWQAANPEKARAHTAAYAARHPERVRDLQQRQNVRRAAAETCEHPMCLIFGPVQLAWDRHPHRCYLCGITLSIEAKRGEPEYLHMDHVMPLAKGGLHCADNLRPACAPCNWHKSDKVLMESGRVH